MYCENAGFLGKPMSNKQKEVKRHPTENRLLSYLTWLEKRAPAFSLQPPAPAPQWGLRAAQLMPMAEPHGNPQAEGEGLSCFKMLQRFPYILTTLLVAPVLVSTQWGHSRIDQHRARSCTSPPQQDGTGKNKHLQNPWNRPQLEVAEKRRKKITLSFFIFHLISRGKQNSPSCISLIYGKEASHRVVLFSSKQLRHPKLIT